MSIKTMTCVAFMVSVAFAAVAEMTCDVAVVGGGSAGPCRRQLDKGIGQCMWREQQGCFQSGTGKMPVPLRGATP